MDNTQAPDPARLLRLPDVRKLVPIARSTLWKWVRTGRFPPPIKIGPRCSCWRAAQVLAWLEAAGTPAPAKA